MALNIRNTEAEKLAETLAKLTGESKTEAVTQALRDRLERLRRERSQRRLVEGLRDLDLFIERAGIEIAAVDTEQAYVARRAFSRFGKGRHEAGLNYGDCFAYALAMVLGEPLLYKGDDFRRTDVTPFVQP